MRDLIARGEPQSHDPGAVRPACMGGWCAHRAHCQRYHTDDRAFVVERLCTRGHEVPEPMPVLVVSSFLNRSGRVMRGAAEASA